jgi:hydrogenase expression/formation protein HypE
MEHGSGGRATGELIGEIFEKAFSNEILSQMEDAAVLPGAGQIAVTTDSFVVTPLEFPGGDIGRLCICGTVNDLLMRGAAPKYITCGFILEEGADIPQLKRIAASMADTAKEAGVLIIAGDTKVVEGSGGVYINTTGVGFVPEQVDIRAANSRPGDVILVSGNLGDHHAAILSSRMEIHNSIKSDNAPLLEMVQKLLENNIRVHVLRDVTRGGLATVLKELAESSGQTFEIREEAIPVDPQVKDFCGLLGLDPLYMGNEGKMIAIVAREDADRALSLIRSSRYGENAAVIGEVCQEEASEARERAAARGEADLSATMSGRLILRTRIGGRRILEELQGEGLPRIC